MKPPLIAREVAQRTNAPCWRRIAFLVAQRGRGQAPLSYSLVFREVVENTKSAAMPSGNGEFPTVGLHSRLFPFLHLVTPAHPALFYGLSMERIRPVLWRGAPSFFRLFRSQVIAVSSERAMQNSCFHLCHGCVGRVNADLLESPFCGSAVVYHSIQ